MPDIREVSTRQPAILPASGAANSQEDQRVAFLARLACQTGVQDEFLTIPDKAVMRFMDELVAPVQQWCAAHAAKVGHCYIAVEGQTPAVFVLGAVEGYDYSLSRPLADLEMDLHRRGWNCQVLQLPVGGPDLLCSFSRESEAIQVFPQMDQPSHADRCGTPATS